MAQRIALSTETPAFHALRRDAASLVRLLEAEQVDLIELGKHYAALATSLLEAVRSSGQTSLRFAAAARALHLRTPRSALEAFVAEG